MVNAADAIAKCRAILGAEYDPFGMLWGNADPAARRVLLKIANRPERWADRSWNQIGAAERAEIKRRARQMQGWLNQFLEGGAE